MLENPAPLMRAVTSDCSTRPDFTGAWKLIPGESDFAFLAPPRLRIDTVIHEGCCLRIQTRQKDANGDLTVVRDLIIGEEASQVIIRGRRRSIRAFWDDTALVVETISEVSGKGRRIRDRWALAEDAERLVIERRYEQPGGAVNQRLVLRRVQRNVDQ